LFWISIRVLGPIFASKDKWVVLDELKGWTYLMHISLGPISLLQCQCLLVDYFDLESSYVVL